MQTSYLRPTYIEIDQEAIYQNVNQEIQRLPKDTQLFAVVKADAYGHGLVQVARVCLEAGARGFCVATIDEALALRQAQITEPILVLGITSVEAVPVAASQQISLTVASVAWLQQANEIIKTVPGLPSIHIHLALDSGMGRIGFTEVNSLAAAVEYLQRHDTIFDFEGIFTHFATADASDEHYFNSQIDKCNQLMAVVKSRPRYVHVANTATSLWHTKFVPNLVRFGIGIYGLNPSGNELEPPYKLLPALSLYSELVFTKQINSGDSIGYGATYQATASEWIGTVPIGYADGWQRRMSGMSVLVDGQRCPIVGRVCMDQIMIRLPHDFPVGTKVTLIGRDGTDEITMQEVAEHAQTIHYEIACGLTNRIPRHYLPVHEED